MASLSLAVRRAESCHGGREATRCEGRTETWRTMLLRVRSITTALQNLGIRTGNRVGILAKNSDIFLQYMYAVAELRAVFVPINIRWSMQEIRFAIQDSSIGLLVLEADLAQRLSTMLEELTMKRCPLVAVLLGSRESEDTELKALRTKIPEITIFTHHQLLMKAQNGWEESSLASSSTTPAREDDVSTIIYTSGSEGKPKGVMLTHQNQIIQAIEKINQVEYSEETRYLNAVPMFHVGGISSAIAVTMVGGTHVFLPKFDPTNFFKCILDEKITTLVVVPSMLSLLVKDIHGRKQKPSSSCQITEFPTVSTILVGGQAMTADLLAACEKIFPQANFIQTYACSEACSSISFALIGGYKLRRLVEDSVGSVKMSLQPRTGFDVSGEEVKGFAVGRPAHHVEICIVDENFNFLPIRKVGLICTRGAHVMLGYLNQPDKTRQVLKNGWLIIGDYGFLDLDGNLCFVSRSSERINSGGEKLYATEVESVLRLHTEVRQV